jgi:hypothetical protein
MTRSDRVVCYALLALIAVGASAILAASTVLAGHRLPPGFAEAAIGGTALLLSLAHTRLLPRRVRGTR